MLEQWKIEELLGEGSYGKVYKVSRNEFGYTYYSALKVITIPRDPSDIRSVTESGMDKESVTVYFHGMVENIVKEFALMTKLRGNTNIVSCEDYEVVQHKDGIGWDIYIRMELLMPLLDYVKEYQLKTEDIIKLGIDICNALEVCQRYGIVHRDIKPANIFISEVGAFKLGDFGIARKLENASEGLSKKGTYTYMAPEVYKGESYDATVDIYSLGLVLYRYLNNNRMPFLPPYPQQITYSDNEKATMLRMSGAEMPFPCNASKRLARIMLKAAAYRPEDRYQRASEMKAELEELLGRMKTGEIESANVKQTVERKEAADAKKKVKEEEKDPKKGGNKGIIMGIVAAIVVIFIGLGIAFWILHTNSEHNEQISDTKRKGIEEKAENDKQMDKQIDTQKNTDKLTSEMITGEWRGSYIGMSNDKKTEKEIAIYIGECDEAGNVKGVAEIEGGDAGYYYWEGTVDFESGKFSFERRDWLSENPDKLKKLTYSMEYITEIQSFQGYIVSDPERTIQLHKAEDSIALKEYWMNREELIKEFN